MIGNANGWNLTGQQFLQVAFMPNEGNDPCGTHGVYFCITSVVEFKRNTLS